MLRTFIFILVGLLALNVLMRQGNSWKVYGSMNCGWTRKQVEELKNNGVAYEFLDCSGGMCKEGMPTNILPDGTRRVGFTSIG